MLAYQTPANTNTTPKKNHRIMNQNNGPISRGGCYCSLLHSGKPLHLFHLCRCGLSPYDSCDRLLNRMSGRDWMEESAAEEPLHLLYLALKPKARTRARLQGRVPVTGNTVKDHQTQVSSLRPVGVILLFTTRCHCFRVTWSFTGWRSGGWKVSELYFTSIPAETRCLL